MQRSCQACHRPGTPAPMSLIRSPKSGRGRDAIKTKVATREMPPWHIDRTIGEMPNDPSLSDLEVATIAKWVDAGAPEERQSRRCAAREGVSASTRMDLRPA